MSIEDDHSELFIQTEDFRIEYPHSSFEEIDNLFFKFKQLYDYAEENEDTLENEMTTNVDDNLQEILEEIKEELELIPY